MQRREKVLKSEGNMPMSGMKTGTDLLRNEENKTRQNKTIVIYKMHREVGKSG